MCHILHIIYIIYIYSIYIYSTNIYSFGRSSHPQHPSYMGSWPLNWRVFRKQPPKVQKTKLLQVGVLSQASSQCVLMQWIWKMWKMWKWLNDWNGNACHVQMAKNYLVGGFNLPLWKMMEWKSVGMMMTFPIWWESHQIPWFQIINRLWLSY